MACSRVAIVSNHVVTGKAMGKGAKGKPRQELNAQTVYNHAKDWHHEKLKKVRTVWRMPEYGGGISAYCSTWFEEGKGTWFECWLDRDAKDHYDIFWAKEWELTGHYFWPTTPDVELSWEEYTHLFPGLKRHGIADDLGQLHWAKVRDANGRVWKPNSRKRFRQRL